METVARGSTAPRPGAPVRSTKRRMLGPMRGDPPHSGRRGNLELGRVQHLPPDVKYAAFHFGWAGAAGSSHSARPPMRLEESRQDGVQANLNQLARLELPELRSLRPSSASRAVPADSRLLSSHGGSHRFESCAAHSPRKTRWSWKGRFFNLPVNFRLPNLVSIDRQANIAC